MFGAELTEFIAFGKHLGLALAGAASLWGLVFEIKCIRENQGQKCIIFEWIAERLFIPLFIGICITALSWLFAVFTTSVYAHEGIALIPGTIGKMQALSITSPVFIGWFLFSAAFLVFKIVKPQVFHKYVIGFYTIQFLVIAFLISFPAWTGEFSRAQLFFIGHGFHSIFTLGTVLILDFLFLLSRHSVILRQHIFPLFPTLSKVIWIGLGIDFLSVALVFDQAITLTPKFFFMQTVIGIIIINGVLLSGPLTRKIITSIQEGGEVLTRRWTNFANTAGVISITAWFSISFVDFFKNLTLSYFQFVLLYIGLLTIGFLGHTIFQKIRTPMRFRS